MTGAIVSLSMSNAPVQDSPLNIGDTITVISEPVDHGIYPDTIVGGILVDIDQDGSHTIWYYNNRGEVVDGRTLYHGRVTRNLNANNGDWEIAAAETASENHGYIQSFMNDPDDISVDVNTALDTIEDTLDIQRDDHYWALGPRFPEMADFDNVKVYEGTWREAQEYCHSTDDDLQVHCRLESAADDDSQSI